MDSRMLDSAVKLHRFLFENFWDGHRILGPDAGLMLNLRVLRFIKGYIPSISRS